MGISSNQSMSPTLKTIEALFDGAKAETRVEGQSLFLKGLIGETQIKVSPSGYKTNDGLEVSEIILIESVMDMPPLPWKEETECLFNMTASNGALFGGEDGKIKIVSRLSLYSGENVDAVKTYMGVVLFSAMIHTNALHGAIIDAGKLAVSKGEPLPNCSVDGAWQSIQFSRATSLLNSAGAFANGDEHGLTAEIPWDPGATTWMADPRKRTSLLRVICEEHPSLGKGLFCKLDLPLNLSDGEAFKLAIKLNHMEKSAEDWPPLLGAWTSQPASGRPTFVSFWPNLFANVIGVEMIAMWMGARARGLPKWISENSAVT